MKKLCICVVFYVGLLFPAFSADNLSVDNFAGIIYEYASVRWSGDRTSIIWPDGTTQKVIAFGGRKRPEATDERAWYLTGAINIMARKGFELAHMGNDDVLMRRPATKLKE